MASKQFHRFHNYMVGGNYFLFLLKSCIIELDGLHEGVHL
jgi:hypothetical protein